MNKGIVIFGHNSNDLDYVKMAELSGKIASNTLSVPVTLITDSKSIKNTSADLSFFDTIQITDNLLPNTRMLNKVQIDFFNTSRSQAYFLSPYDRTLLIDSDLFILSKKLNEFWNNDTDFLICKSMDPIASELSFSEKFLSSSSLQMNWATAIMFSKTSAVKKIFETVTYVRDNWFYFCDLYGITSNSFRNDFAFTIANHIVNGHSSVENFLPPILFADQTINVNALSNSEIVLKIKNEIVSYKDVDIHIMNKFSIKEFL